MAVSFEKHEQMNKTRIDKLLTGFKLSYAFIIGTSVKFLYGIKCVLK